MPKQSSSSPISRSKRPRRGEVLEEIAAFLKNKIIKSSPVKNI